MTGGTFAFTGTRQGMTDQQLNRLGKLLLELRPTHMNNGDCVGADAEAQDLCAMLSFGPTIKLYPAFECGHPLRWGQFCCPNKGGPYRHEKVVYINRILKPLTRNKVMVDSAQYTIACPAEAHEVLRSGTWSTIRYTRKVGKRLYLIHPDGSIHQ